METPSVSVFAGDNYVDLYLRNVRNPVNFVISFYKTPKIFYLIKNATDEGLIEMEERFMRHALRIADNILEKKIQIHSDIFAPEEVRTAIFHKCVDSTRRVLKRAAIFRCTLIFLKAVRDEVEIRLEMRRREIRRAIGRIVGG